jgi:hypothetical protein
MHVRKVLIRDLCEAYFCDWQATLFDQHQQQFERPIEAVQMQLELRSVSSRLR